MISRLKTDIKDYKQKVGALEDGKERLKKTLQETQQELLKLVEAHEILTKKDSSKYRDMKVLSKELEGLKRGLEKKQTLLDEYQDRLEEKDQEIAKMRDRLSQRDTETLNNERTFRSELQYQQKSHQEME